LHEVLKHDSMWEAVMIEIDEELTNVSQTYLPEWSDCSDVAAGGGDERITASRFDDPKTTVRFEDAFGYFLRNFGGDEDDVEMERRTTKTSYST